MNTKLLVLLSLLTVVALSGCLASPEATETAATPKVEASPVVTAVHTEQPNSHVVGYRLNALDGKALVVVLIEQVVGFDWSMLENGGVHCNNQSITVEARAVSQEVCGDVEANPWHVAFGKTTVSPHDVVSFDAVWYGTQPLGLSWDACRGGVGFYNTDYDRSGTICQLVEEILR
jgi:high-affinity K+ transport system ATPase subunit B